MLLKANNLSVNYGAVRALENVSFHVDSGEIVAMIGPNGAGKSTALKAVSGLLDEYGGEVIDGSIEFNDKSITGLRTDQLVRNGIALVPEGRRVFPTMTVFENLEMGLFSRDVKKNAKEELEVIFDLFPRLKERAKQKAGTLSTGEQQMLALGRSIVLKPKLLLADEPSLGLSPNFVDIIFDKLQEINRMGTTILLVEQNARMALDVAHRAYVFSVGKIELEGKTGDLIENEKVKRTFLGG